MLDHAHIAGGHEEGAQLGLLHRDGEVGAFFFVDGVVPAAGLGAGAAVAVAAVGHDVGQKTAAAVGHAHGAVDEGLQLDILGEGRLDGLDLGELQLSGQHQAAGTHTGVGTGGGGGDDAGLGGDVDLHVGEHLLHRGHDTQVGHDEGIQLTASEVVEEFVEVGVFVGAGHGVEGQVDLFPHAVGKLYRLVELGDGEVARLGAHTELLTRQVDGIGTVGKGGAELFGVACGGKKLGHIVFSCDGWIFGHTQLLYIFYAGLSTGLGREFKFGFIALR